MPPRTTVARPVADALHSAAIHLLRGVRREDEHAGIGPARLSALSVLVFGGPLRLTELARLEQVRPPTMTRIVDGLVRRRLVRRTADRDDARAVRLEATARGRSLLDAGRQRRVRRIEDAMMSLSDEELDVLRRAVPILERVAASVRALTTGPDSLSAAV